MLALAQVSPIRRAQYVRAFCDSSLISRWRLRGESLWHGFKAYRFVTAPLALLSTGTALAGFYRSWNPEDYARWYLSWISAGVFREPHHDPPWVHNAAMQSIVKEGLKKHPNEERMVLISGLQQSGKTSAVLKECHAQHLRGFFVDLGGSAKIAFPTRRAWSCHLPVLNAIFQFVRGLGSDREPSILGVLAAPASSIPKINDFRSAPKP